MHVLFVHQNFPAQFGQIAQNLAEKHGWRCTFVSEKPAGIFGKLEGIQYRVRGGATQRTNFCSRSFENAIWVCRAVYDALKSRPDIQPDLVVGHSGFGSTLFLRELYACPTINYFEFFYRPHGSDLDFRPDFPPTEDSRLRIRARNAMILLDLDNCDEGYSPTGWQRDQLPQRYHDKVRVIFDGVDTNLWRPLPSRERRLGGLVFPDNVRIVTYVSRGFESTRGFDIFMKMAKRLYQRRRDVIFLIAGQDRSFYSGDENFTGGKPFGQWVLQQDDYDLSRFVFVGALPPPMLAEMFNLSDIHVYLTVPFVLSWSLWNALACGCTVLASDTAPVREIISHGQNGWLVDFFDIEGLASAANTILDKTGDYRRLGSAGVELVRRRYSLEVCLPQIRAMFESCGGRINS